VRVACELRHTHVTSVKKARLGMGGAEAAAGAPRGRLLPRPLPHVRSPGVRHHEAPPSVVPFLGGEEPLDRGYRDVAVAARYREWRWPQEGKSSAVGPRLSTFRRRAGRRGSHRQMSRRCRMMARVRPHSNSKQELRNEPGPRASGIERAGLALTSSPMSTEKVHVSTGTV